MTDYESQMAFEAEVRRVAEAVFGLAPGDCQPAHYTKDPVLHELDGVVRLRDVSHLIMATTSRRLDKAKDDIKKLNAAERVESKRGLPAVKWFITQTQLAAEHVQLAQKNGVQALTLENFRSRFFNGHDYLAKRRVHAFGSARNLKDGSITIDETEYIELPMMRRSGKESKGAWTPVRVGDITNGLSQGEFFVLVAPFGSGKSLTAREVFFQLEKTYLAGVQTAVPVAINLREHWGQVYGDEILERHARAIGFTRREDLIVACRAGIAALILDGFDELASQAVARANDLNFMRLARAQAVQAVRYLLVKLPASTGVLLCGRDHYFDDERELQHAVGISGRRFTLIRLGEFTEEQATKFLSRNGVNTPLPDWLPRKPLLLGYLAYQNLLQAIVAIDSTRGFGYAWDQFLDLVCQREAEHERAVMDPQTVRKVLERLACDVRATPSGTGPISGIDLAEAYRLETGMIPGEGVLMQLQRLPGLAQREQDPTVRSFIDTDLLAALQGSAISRFVLENVGGKGARSWLGALPEKGVAMASYLLQRAQAAPATVIAIGMRVAGIEGSRQYEPQIAADCVAVALEMAREAGTLDCLGAALEGVAIGVIDLEDIQITNLKIRGCLVDEVILGSNPEASTVMFFRCTVQKVSGVPSEDGLPKSMFQECQFGEFDHLSTNAAILRSRLEPAIMALFTILRKLYLQAGGGRKVKALKRGMRPGPVLDAVDDVVEILESAGLVYQFSDVVHPIRRQTARVHAILSAGALSDDELVKKVKNI